MPIIETGCFIETLFEHLYFVVFERSLIDIYDVTAVNCQSLKKIGTLLLCLFYMFRL